MQPKKIKATITNMAMSETIAYSEQQQSLYIYCCLNSKLDRVEQSIACIRLSGMHTRYALSDPDLGNPTAGRYKDQRFDQNIIYIILEADSDDELIRSAADLRYKHNIKSHMLYDDFTLSYHGWISQPVTADQRKHFARLAKTKQDDE